MEGSTEIPQGIRDKIKHYEANEPPHGRQEKGTSQLTVTTELFVVKLREREGEGVDPGRSLKGHLWMVDGGWWYPFPRALH